MHQCRAVIISHGTYWNAQCWTQGCGKVEKWGGKGEEEEMMRLSLRGNFEGTAPVQRKFYWTYL